MTSCARTAKWAALGPVCVFFHWRCGSDPLPSPEATCGIARRASIMTPAAIANGCSPAHAVVILPKTDTNTKQRSSTETDGCSVCPEISGTVEIASDSLFLLGTGCVEGGAASRPFIFPRTQTQAASMASMVLPVTNSVTVKRATGPPFVSSDTTRDLHG